ncbi:hypothetical protein [Candidatus Pristimantibacillus sp. PTI5]|uniref:hypothetical protein n=1 Tax=Candidatus Pristimantibacillus sp. PTI5 TaxID=3400422 RepID=UPI003B01CA4E
MSTRTVHLYKESIRKQCYQLFGSLDRLEAYISVVCTHELGHAEDKQLCQLADRMDQAITHRERAETALKIEEHAWKYAELLLPNIDQAFIGVIIEQSLAAYRLELGPEIA